MHNEFRASVRVRLRYLRYFWRLYTHKRWLWKIYDWTSLKLVILLRWSAINNNIFGTRAAPLIINKNKQNPKKKNYVQIYSNEYIHYNVRTKNENNRRLVGRKTCNLLLCGLAVQWLSQPQIFVEFVEAGGVPAKPQADYIDTLRPTENFTEIDDDGRRAVLCHAT